MTEKPLYVAMRLVERAPTSLGLDFSASGYDGRAGFLPVFRTKTAARKVYGRSVELFEIRPLTSKEPK